MTNIVSNKVGTHIQNVLGLALDNAIKQKESCTFWHFLREGNLGGLIGTIGRSAQAAQLGRALIIFHIKNTVKQKNDNKIQHIAFHIKKI